MDVQADLEPDRASRSTRPSPVIAAWPCVPFIPVKIHDDGWISRWPGQVAHGVFRPSQVISRAGVDVEVGVDGDRALGVVAGPRGGVRCRWAVPRTVPAGLNERTTLRTSGGMASSRSRSIGSDSAAKSRSTTAPGALALDRPADRQRLAADQRAEVDRHPARPRRQIAGDVLERDSGTPCTPSPRRGRVTATPQSIGPPGAARARSASRSTRPLGRKSAQRSATLREGPRRPVASPVVELQADDLDPQVERRPIRVVQADRPRGADRPSARSAPPPARSWPCRRGSPGRPRGR